MKVVLVKPRGSTLIAAFIVLMTLVFLIPLIRILPSVTGDRGFLFGVIGFLFLIDGVAVYFLLSLSREGKRAGAFLSTASVSESGVSFLEELEFEYGILNMKAWWSGSGSNKHYHVERDFKTAGTARASSVPFVNAEFKMAIRKDGSGFVSAPAVKILSEPYKDVVLLFITEKGEVNAGGTLLLSADSDSAQVTVKGVEKAITGSVYATLSKARKVRVSLSAPEVTYEFPIAEGESFEFSHQMLPSEKILIVGGYKVLEPRAILKDMGVKEIIMGHGDFGLKATLDLPLRKDVSENMSFTVSLKEREEWGF